METNQINSTEEQLLKTESSILKEEKAILKEEHKIIKLLKNRQMIEMASAGIVILVLIGGFIYWNVTESRVYSDKAVISAPLIAISPEKSDVLKEILVRVGDTVDANTIVARVGDELLKANTKGMVVAVDDAIGKLFMPGMPVVTMIDPKDLRVVATIEEDKGFTNVQLGQHVVFTVDAFGSRKFDGVVDEVAKTSDQSSVVFNISDKRQQQDFTVKVKYDTAVYQDFLNGMSARVWIYK